MSNDKISTDLFLYLYSTLTTNIPASVGDRLADEFFLKCNIKKISTITYIAEHVVITYFHYYFDTKVNFKVYDDFYILMFEDNLNLFIEVVNKIVKYLMEDVIIEDVSDENEVKWKLYRK